ASVGSQPPPRIWTLLSSLRDLSSLRLGVRFLEAVAGFGEALLDGRDLLGAGGLEGELDPAFTDGGVREGAVVLDVHDVGPALGDERRQAREGTGLVTEDHAEAHEAAVLDEAAHDDPRDHRDVDIAAGEDEHDVAPGETEPAVQERGQRRRAGALDHGLLDLE